MTEPQPDTETLVADLRNHVAAMRGTVWDSYAESAEEGIELLAARLVEAEAIVALVVQSKFGEAQEQAHAYFQPEVEQRLAAALDSLPSQPAQPDARCPRCGMAEICDEPDCPNQDRDGPSLTAEDAAYVARRAAWERK